jgi:hypothetical protein
VAKVRLVVHLVVDAGGHEGCPSWLGHVWKVLVAIVIPQLRRPQHYQ